MKDFKICSFILVSWLGPDQLINITSENICFKLYEQRHAQRTNLLKKKSLSLHAVHTSPECWSKAGEWGVQKDYREGWPLLTVGPALFPSASSV
jgi:hypothetical protein